jgi:hypothetical protein
MHWPMHVRAEFARLRQGVDDSVVDELSRHPEAEYEAAILTLKNE